MCILVVALASSLAAPLQGVARLSCRGTSSTNRTRIALRSFTSVPADWDLRGRLGPSSSSSRPKDTTLARVSGLFAGCRFVAIQKKMQFSWKTFPRKGKDRFWCVFAGEEEKRAGSPSAESAARDGTRRARPRERSGGHRRARRTRRGGRGARLRPGTGRGMVEAAA